MHISKTVATTSTVTSTNRAPEPTVTVTMTQTVEVTYEPNEHIKTLTFDPWGGTPYDVAVIGWSIRSTLVDGVFKADEITAETRKVDGTATQSGPVSIDQFVDREFLKKIATGFLS